MNDNDVSVQESEFDPQQLILRAKRRRNFSERFESFSDAYVWVLAAIVALAYLFSAIFGLIFALLGQGVAHQKMPAAVWSLQELSPILLALGAIYLLRLFLHLGPVGINAAKADWWLPLPLGLAVLRSGALRNALIVGMLSSTFVGVLWLIVLYGLAGAFHPLVAGCAVVCFVLAGVFIASVGVVVQSYGLQRLVQHWIDGCLVAIGALLMIFWGLLAMGKQWAKSVVENVGSSVLHLPTWICAATVLLVLSVIFTWWAAQRNLKITSRSLRSSGEKQQRVLGVLMQADSRSIGAPSATVLGYRRRRGRRIAANLTIAWRILVLRLIRGGYWQSIAGYLLLVLGLTATVEQIANPLSMLVFYLMVGVLLPLNLSGVIAPMLTQRQLTQHLGQPSAKLERTAALFAVIYSVATLSLLTGGLGLLGVVDLSNFWWWCAAVFAGSLGAAAASLGHAQRNERDWESLLGSATSDTSVAIVLYGELSTLVRAVAPLAPLFSMILSPDADIPWPLWVISLLFTLPALRLIVGRKF
ncbi:hypothetical protein [Glutamicibacter sp. JC586]|uniref:hypothetical protein n=1 Tax=Glutamicibacter sp. JC586 TaxID=2590552 RepID=UPI0013574994|nr:hypothetical protein [Glutamicibacter sp. JC586]